MMRFEWNALRVGDPVRVHIDGAKVVDGEVAFVDVMRGSNGLGIRVATADGGPVVHWPSRMAVHRAIGDLDDRCLRCHALREGAA